MHLCLRQVEFGITSCITGKRLDVSWELVTWPNVSSVSPTGAGNSFSSFEDQDIVALDTVLD